MSKYSFSTLDYEPVDTALATSFLEDLHEESPSSEWLSGWCIDHDTGRRSTVWSRVDEPDRLVGQISALTGRISAYVGVATRKAPLSDGARGGITDCASVPALWVDIDVRGPNHVSADLPPSLKAATALIDEYPDPPSIVVETGGGLQAYWGLERSMPNDSELARLLARWGATWTALSQAHGWRIDNVWDISRVLRLPGSINNKQLHAPVPVVLRQESRLGT